MISFHEVECNAENINTMINDQTVLYASIAGRYDIDTVKQILHLKADPNITDNGDSPLLLAARTQQFEHFQELLKANADITHRYVNNSALDFAVSQNKTDKKFMRELINVGVDINQQDLLGNTALMVCSEYCGIDNNIECLQELITAKADVNLQDERGNTALMIACTLCAGTSGIEGVRELIWARADINLQDKKGDTALIMAVKRCNTTSNIECIQELLRAGADWDIINHNGEKAKDFANIEIKKLIRKYKRYRYENLQKRIIELESHTQALFGSLMCTD